MAPAAQDFWEQECMEKAALQRRGHVPGDDTEEKLYWGGGKLEGEVAFQEDPERPKKED